MINKNNENILEFCYLVVVESSSRFLNAGNSYSLLYEFLTTK